MTAVVITAVNKKKRSVELMKMKKRIMGILLSIALVMGLIPSMSLTAYAKENHQIHNTISDIISLSITRNGTPVTEANSGDTITLTVNGSLTTGSNSTFSRFDRNIMIDGLAVSDTGGNEVSLQSAGSLSWTFTMPNSDVYITFPLLTADSSIPVGAGQAVFRSGKSNGNGYSFIANKQDGSSYDDTVGYLAYIESGENYKFVVDDDSGSNGNSYRNFRIPSPSSGQVSIDNGTYFHIGFALYSNYHSGTFSPSGNTGDITISFIAVQKTRQIISANNLTISVNDMDKKVNASITNGDGTLSYTVLEGTDVITVNRNTGAITPLKTGTARIEIEASETDTFQRTTSTITVTVEKARAVAATVAANNRTYDGTEKPLVTISGEPTGGTMYYALGEDTTTAPDDNLFTTSIPAKTDVGTYYVWYKAVGDENHTDSAADKVEVTISSPSSQGGGEVIGNGEKSTEELKEEFKNETPKDNSAAKKVLGENATTADAIDALVGEQKTELINSAINDAGNLKIEGEGAKLNDVSDIATAVLDPSELVQVVLGDNIVIDLKVADKPESSVNTATKNKIVETAGAKANNGLFFFDADLFVTVNNGEPTPVTKFAKAISFTRDIPESLRGAGRIFSAIYTHDNNGTLESGTLEDQDNDPNTFTGSTDRLCTMALVYTQSTSNSSTPVTADSASPKTDNTSYNPFTWSTGNSSDNKSSSSSKEDKTYSKGRSKGYYTKTGKKTAEYTAPAIKHSAKIAVVPATVKIGKKTYKVTSIASFAFTGYDKLETVVIGENVVKISPDAFSGCEKLKVLKIKSKKLTKKKIKNCLRGSKIDTIIILKKAWRKFKFYKKIFTKKNTGASDKLTVKKGKK